MKRILLIFCIIAITLPFSLGWIKLDKEPSFFGEQLTMGQTIHKFTWHRWFNDIIQKKVESSAVFNTGYHNLLIRFANELNYRILVQPKAAAIVSGRSGYLFDNNYIDEYAGRIYCGEEFLSKKIQYLKIVQDFLLKEKGISLIPVLEPGIASYNRDFLPMSAVCRADGKTNYKTLKDVAKKANIRMLDLEAIFSQKIKPSQYTIFPEKSLHWGPYGCYLAADTLYKFTAKTTNLSLPTIILDSVYISKTPTPSENEIERSMNLLRIRPHKNYNHVALRFDTTDKARPNALFIADSYALMYEDLLIPSNMFKDHTLWYYNTTVYPFNEGPNAIWVKSLNLKEEIEKRSIILLMANELNYYRMYWNFVEKTMQIYGFDSIMDENYKAKNFIVNSKILFPQLLKYSNLHKIPFENALDNLSQMIILAKRNSSNKWITLFWSTYFTNRIFKDTGLLDQLNDMAEKYKTSLDIEVYKSSLWSYEQDIIKANYY
jgi:hypothetical protein